MNIGFIGLGHMGLGMALNLVKSGHTVHAFDLSPEALAKAETGGAIIANSLQDACRDAQAIVTMLPAGTHVVDVYAKVFKCAPKSAILIDCSTIDILTARETIELAATQGFNMVDAPVSGGVAAANSGSLTFMVGGTNEAFDRAKTILESMGKAVIHAGLPSMGQAAKICNNMLLAITMIGTCEAFGLAEKLGLNTQIFFDISSKASGQNWSMTSYCPVAGPVPTSPANNDYLPGFAAALMLKDLNLAMQASFAHDASTPLGAKAQALYEVLCSEGHAHQDFSYMMQRIRRGS